MNELSTIQRAIIKELQEYQPGLAYTFVTRLHGERPVKDLIRHGYIEKADGVIRLSPQFDEMQRAGGRSAFVDQLIDERDRIIEKYGITRMPPEVAQRYSRIKQLLLSFAYGG